MYNNSLSGSKGIFSFAFDNHYFLPDMLREIANSIENCEEEKQKAMGVCSHGNWEIKYHK